LEKQAGSLEPQKKKRKRGGRGRNKGAGPAVMGEGAPKSVSPGQKITF